MFSSVLRLGGTIGGRCNRAEKEEDRILRNLFPFRSVSGWRRLLLLGRN